MDYSKPLVEVRPSWWHFFWYFVFFWLLIPVIIAILKRKAMVLRIYEDRIFLETGVLSKNYTEVFIKDIRAINIYQGFVQRIVHIGSIMIATAGTYGYEFSMDGLPEPIQLKNIIMNQTRS